MTTDAEIVCKKFLIERCVLAVISSIGMQYMSLAVFLLFINFNILHPVQWLASSLSLVFSFYTWLCVTPLTAALILYGIYLSYQFLTPKKFYVIRFTRFFGTIAGKTTEFLLNGLIGFLTAWLYTRFLNDQYKTLLIKCFDSYCINESFIYLAFSGIYSGIYFFIKKRLNKDAECKYPVVHQKNVAMISTYLYSILRSSLVKMIVPTLLSAVIYWLFGWFFVGKLTTLIEADLDDSFSTIYSILTNFRLIAYAWILNSQIISNMFLMDVLFASHLSRPKEFQIEKSIELHNNSNHITLVDALAFEKHPIVKNLASLDLLNLANSSDPARRKIIFSISVPGGHPYNWKQLSGQCLSLLNSFTEELSNSIKTISILHKNEMPIDFRIPITSAKIAEKILFRQYNENSGIRSMVWQQQPPQHHQDVQYLRSNERFDPRRRLNQLAQEFFKSFEESLRIFLNKIPGYIYLFREQEGEKIYYLLSESKSICWICQGLSTVCSASFSEDEYGVVQSDLATIIKALMNLKLNLDKISGLNLNGRRNNGSNGYIALRNSVKRSLYRICTVFGDYLQDILLDEDDLRQAQLVANGLEN